jgi:hypothetical protein
MSKRLAFLRVCLLVLGTIVDASAASTIKVTCSGSLTRVSDQYACGSFSEGQVNIFNLAKNARTSVDQIERFYARNLPLSREMAINLQICRLMARNGRAKADDQCLLIGVKQT